MAPVPWHAVNLHRLSAARHPHATPYKSAVSQRPGKVFGTFARYRRHVTRIANHPVTILDRLATATFAVCAFALLMVGGVTSLDAAVPKWIEARDMIFRVVAAGSALPESNTPLSIAQDRAGFIWIANEAGVSRWDGRSFKTFSADGRPGSLPERIAKVVGTDTQGRLWAGLSSEGLLRFDPETETFKRPANATPLDRERIYAVATGGNGKLWVASDSGVNRVDGRTQKVDYGIGRRLGLPAGAASSIAEDSRGRLHAVVDGQLYRQDRSGGRLRLVDLARAEAGLPAPAATTLLVDRADRVWVSTRSSGAILIDPSGNPLRRVRFRPGGTATPQPMAMTAIEVRPELFWFDTHEGIYEIDARTWAVRRMHHEVDRAGSLPDDSVNSLMIDRSGLVWVGAAATLSIADPRPSPAASIQTALGQGAGTRVYRAWTVGTASNGRLWLGAQDDPVRILEPVAGAFPRRLPGENLRPRGVTSFAFLPNGEVYAASELGLFRMNGDGSALKQVSNAPARRLLLVGPMLYVGGSKGLSKLDTRMPGARLTQALDAALLTFPRVTALRATPGGILWIGTSHGLNRFNPADGTITRFEPDIKDPTALGANYINSLLTDRYGRLWVATGGGLDILERNGRGKMGFRHLRRRDGLPNDVIDTLLPGPDGSIWASTDGGVVRIEPLSLAMTTLREAEGLQSPAHWAGDGAISGNGDMIFAGTVGLTIVNPTAVRALRARSPLVVTDLRVGARTLPFASAGRTPRIEVPPEAGSFAVEFSALDFAATDRISYSYRLSGLETGWTQADPAHRTARYTNLPPGDYVLQLRASGRDGASNGSALDIPVRVVAAWYQTYTFRGAMALLFLAICWGVMQLRVHFIRRRERMLEAVIAERTAELQRSQNELKKLAYFDALTGLANRRMFTENLERLLTPAERQAPAFALILVDLDKFKTINDTHGHDAGDALLIEAAGRLVSSVRENDSVARLGGDEFAILVSGHIDAKSLEVLCGRVIDAVACPIVFAGRSIDTSASLGVALFPDNGQTQDELYKAADLALYAAKRAGRNTWRRYADLSPGVDLMQDSSTEG